MQDTDPQAAVEPTPSSAVSTKGRSFLTAVLLAPGAGLLASLMAAMLMIVLRLVAGLPAPVELFGDFVLKHIDVGTFLRLLITFSPNSKTTPLGLALVGMIALGTVLSALYAVIVRVELPAKG